MQMFLKRVADLAATEPVTGRQPRPEKALPGGVQKPSKVHCRDAEAASKPTGASARRPLHVSTDPGHENPTQASMSYIGVVSRKKPFKKPLLTVF